MSSSNYKANDTGAICEELISIRDWLRFAVSQFESEQLAYGHGTHNALDEAAFLILAILNLPVNDINPWLDCRLTFSERQKILTLIDERVATRKPASYLVNQAFIGPHKFYVDERVIVPRSYIGELLDRGHIEPVLAGADEVEDILELCTGSGCLAILAALHFPHAKVTAVDISQDALDVAQRNIADYALTDRIELVKSDLFEAIPGRKFDLILANPPYVTQAAVDSFPPEWRAEPQVAHLGGDDGLDIVHRILDAAPGHLHPHGTLIVEIGQARPGLEEARADLPFVWLETETSEGEVFALSAFDLGSSLKQS